MTEQQFGKGIDATGDIMATTAIASAVAGYMKRQEVLHATGDPHLANSLGTNYGIGLFFTICGGLGALPLLLFTVLAAQTINEPTFDADPSGGGATNGPTMFFFGLIPLLCCLGALWVGIYLLREVKRQTRAAVNYAQTPPPIPGLPAIPVTITSTTPEVTFTVRALKRTEVREVNPSPPRLSGDGTY